MTTYEDLEKEFDAKVEKLQAECLHRKISLWMDVWWAPGHSTGESVKQCEICRKRIAWRGIKKICPECKTAYDSCYIDCNKCHAVLEPFLMTTFDLDTGVKNGKGKSGA
jgi:hypothetical protein